LFVQACVFSETVKPPFLKMIPFSGFSISRMDDLYRYINWATISNIKDECPDRKPD